jgi:hypothetical protein
MRAVFQSGFPYEPMFQPAMTDRLIVALVLDRFSKPQLEAIVSAAASVGDDSFFFAITGSSDDPGEYWPNASLQSMTIISRRNIEPYWDTPEGGTKAIWSPTSQWGSLVSDQWFGALGGTKKFVTIFKERYPPWPPEGVPRVVVTEQVRLFLEDVSRSRPVAWCN